METPYEIIGSYYENGNIHLMFATTGMYDLQDRGHKLFVINCEQKKSLFLRFQSPKLELNEKLNYTHIKVEGDFLLMDMFLYSGMGYKGYSGIYIYNLVTGRGSLMRIENELLDANRNFVQNVSINLDKNEYWIDVKAIVKGGNTKFFTVVFNNKGEVIKYFNQNELTKISGDKIVKSHSEYLNDGTIFNISLSKSLSAKDEKKLKNKYKSHIANKIILTKVNGTDTIYTNSIGFDELETFNIQGVATALIENTNGIEQLYLKNELIHHPILIQQDRSYLFTEIYREQTYTSEGVTYIAGYQYAGALLLCLNDEGELLWNKVFYNFTKQLILEPQMSIQLNNENNISISYANFDKKVDLTLNKYGIVLTEQTQIVPKTIKSYDLYEYKNFQVKNWHNSVIIYAEEKDKNQLSYKRNYIIDLIKL